MQIRIPNSILITMILSAAVTVASMSKVVSAAFTPSSSSYCRHNILIRSATSSTTFMMGAQQRSNNNIINSKNNYYGRNTSSLYLHHQRQRQYDYNIITPKRPYMTSTSLASSTSSTSTPFQLKGIDWIRNNIVTVLNDTFDSKEVARTIALNQLEPKKKKQKKKKKNKKDDNDNTKVDEHQQDGEEQPSLTQEQKDAIANEAASNALPFSTLDAMVTPATKLEFGDYQCNAAMSLAKNVNMNPRECAMKIVDGLRPLIEDFMEEPEIAGPGFINLRFKKEYLEESIHEMAKDPQRLAIPLSA